jgi:general stress protein 26
MKHIQLLPDWMYHTIEESFTCQFTSVTKSGTPVALPVFLNHFDPDTGTLIISSPAAVKRLENVRQHPEVAMLFSQVGVGKGESPHVLLVQGMAEVDDTDLEHGWKRYFAGWARRQPSARETVPKMRQMWPGYVQRAIIRVQPTRFLGWPEGDMQRTPEAVEVHGATSENQRPPALSRRPRSGRVTESDVMIVWTDELIAQIGSYSRAALSYMGESGYPVTLPLPFTFDRLEHHFTFPRPSQPPAISSEAEGSTSITLLRYDQQRANEAYLLFYGQLARHDDTWSFTPTRVVHRSLERREQKKEFQR